MVRQLSRAQAVALSYPLRRLPPHSELVADEAADAVYERALARMGSPFGLIKTFYIDHADLLI